MGYQAPQGRAIRQGDLLSNVRSFQLTHFDGATPHGVARTYTHAVVVTQDCDLEQDYGARFGDQQVSDDKKLFGVLLCGAYEEAAIKAGTHRAGAKKFGRQEWKPVTQNKEPRYQYLGFVRDTDAVLVADFKDYFMVPCDYLYGLLDEGTSARVAELGSPWRDHLLQRFAGYLMRIGLPTDFLMFQRPRPEQPEPE
jgi:hypothetical protein